MTGGSKDISLRGFAGFMRQKRQLTDLLALAGVLFVVGVVFHLLYPFPFTFPDSASYVYTANDGVFNVYRPMGYSTYMAWVRGLAHGPTALFAVSYLLNAAAVLFMLFSARYLLGLERRWLFYTLSVAAILAPRIIFSTNFIMSDGLFNTLTMIFVTTAMWLVFSRNLWLAAAHLLVLLLLYKVRYSGIFFLPVSVAALWMAFAGRGKVIRLAVSLAPLLLFALLFTSTKREYSRQTGVDTFSGFGGWQLINNASVLLPEAKEIKPAEFAREVQLLHQFIRQCPDSLFDRRHTMSTDYMWSNDLPYKQFLLYYSDATGMPYPQAWAAVGKMYGTYAGELIREYPGRYFTQFLLPSLGSMFRCGEMIEERLEFRGEPLYREFFGITQQSYKHKNHLFAAIYPIRQAINYIYWLGLGACAAWFCAVMLRRGVHHPKRRNAAALVLGFLLIYFFSSALASPCTTWRYTMPMFVPSLVFMSYCIGAFLDRRTRLKGGRA